MRSNHALTVGLRRTACQADSHSTLRTVAGPSRVMWPSRFLSADASWHGRQAEVDAQLTGAGEAGHVVATYATNASAVRTPDPGDRHQQRHGGMAGGGLRQLPLDAF